MAKTNRKPCDSNQLSLFPKDSSAIPTGTDLSGAYDAIMGEIRRRRMSFTSKEEYYRSPEWQYKRKQKLEQVGNKCESCGKVRRLDIHHLDYSNLYDERMEDLQALCRDCHGSADSTREYSSALATYLYKRFGDNACLVDASDYVDEFDEWLESKQEW